MTIKIVTDSACDVPEAIAQTLDITVVPVYINIGDKSYQEGVELSRHSFYQKLSGYNPYPTTSAPSTGTFADVYQRLAQQGATDIISIHIAHDLSATYNAARVGAAAQDAVRVTLFDTQQISLAAGLLVMLAAQAAKAGQTVKEIIDMLNDRAQQTYLFGVIDTLDSLRRSGRVNWAEFGVGTLLQIKPVMMIHHGVISIAGKIRTHKRAIAHVLNLLSDMAPLEQLAVVHVNAPEMAEKLKEQAGQLFPNGLSLPIMEITPAIGLHLGLGAVGFACITQKD
ncbi:MAG: DegV family protein [Anaerolineae bacterium]